MSPVQGSPCCHRHRRGPGKVIPAQCFGEETPSCGLLHRWARVGTGGIGGMALEGHHSQLVLGFPIPVHF